MVVIVSDIGLVELVDHMVVDPVQKVAMSARVSMAGDKKVHTREQNEKLARYLASHQPPHTSPFRHSYITLHVECPEFVARQWYKHVVGGEYTYKDTGWNEVSGRYLEMQDFWMPTYFHLQSPSKKQGGTEEITKDYDLVRAYAEAVNKAHEVYNQLIAAGVAREEARAVLPLSMMTRFYWTASMQAVKHFVNLRNHPDAQVQIRNFAVAVDSICSSHYGKAWEVFNG